MTPIRIFTKSYCPYCVAAKDLFKTKGYEYEEISVEENQDNFFTLVEKHNHRTVPMIFIGETFVGGFDQLKKLNDEGKLEEMMG
ncbi:MAG: glutaredoxin domain-containing protein [Candidatus Peregrinibacteria bacterium]